ncbi:uncharacterized protein L3040_005231 [Drepanopeziza brunnea f. sp. 'multigermtubi']|uniref:uncharacterized protein n=1 Tax=Drepanopeziza brunnea f. sp. 'multigermtubi' TaxID=698441 RepID=UPI00239F5B28|nr:hypothetical protein L3040_005231 [Drepanopeziza brunnea f. sp. 'multigermtubi']
MQNAPIIFFKPYPVELKGNPTSRQAGQAMRQTVPGLTRPPNAVRLATSPTSISTSKIKSPPPDFKPRLLSTIEPEPRPEPLDQTELQRSSLYSMD